MLKDSYRRIEFEKNFGIPWNQKRNLQKIIEIKMRIGILKRKKNGEQEPEKETAK